MQASDATIDTGEVGRFAAQADAWWDPDGSFRALHRLNPVRLGFIRSRLLTPLWPRSRLVAAVRRAEPASTSDAAAGSSQSRWPGSVLRSPAIDAGSEAIAAAREHARGGRLDIDYHVATAESLADAGERFDAVLALEVIEHLADRDAFWRSVGELVTPGGAFIAATINRTARSFALAIVGAEYVLGWMPRGTHDWRNFVRPSEFVLSLRRNGLHADRDRRTDATISARANGCCRGIVEVNYLVMAELR